MQNNAGFLSTLEQRCVITRLMDEMREAFRELEKGTFLRAQKKSTAGSE